MGYRERVGGDAGHGNRARWLRLLAALAIVAASLLVGNVTLNLLLAARGGNAECTYFEPPDDAVIGEGADVFPRSKIRVIPPSIECTYVQNSGETVAVSHDLGAAKALLSLGFAGAGWALLRAARRYPA